MSIKKNFVVTALAILPLALSSCASIESVARVDSSKNMNYALRGDNYVPPLPINNQVKPNKTAVVVQSTPQTVIQSQPVYIQPQPATTQVQQVNPSVEQPTFFIPAQPDNATYYPNQSSSTGLFSKLFKKNEPAPVYQLPQVTAPSPLEIISQETQKAMNAQMMLTKYRQSYNETLNAHYADFSTDKLRVDYIGKPQGILNSIAIKYGFRFLEQGYKTDNLPTVNFTNYYATPEDIVIAVDSQLQQTANIALDKANKTIVLIYK